MFPALPLGSLPGYKTEILHPYWAPQLAADLIDAALAYVREQHVATIIAPWVADRGNGKRSPANWTAAARSPPTGQPRTTCPCGTAPCRSTSPPRSRDRYRYRYRQDMLAAQALGLSVRTLTTAELRSSLPRIGALAAATRRRHGQDIADTEVPTVLARLLDREVPLLCVGGFRHGQLVACCVSVEKASRIYAKHAKFDYPTLGTRSGAHFAVVIYGTLAAAYDRRARVVEYGIGAHQAKALRGCQPRSVTSYLLTGQPRTRDLFTAAAAVHAPVRRAEYASP